MPSREVITMLAEQKLKDIGGFLVDVNVSPANKIVVEIDHENGVSITDCVEISRYIESKLNREEEDFELQVSSPGLDVPFKVKEQYYKNIGNEIEVISRSGDTIKGTLLSVKGNSLLIQPAQNKKAKNKKAIEPSEIDFSQIAKAKKVVSFKK